MRDHRAAGLQKAIRSIPETRDCLGTDNDCDSSRSCSFNQACCELTRTLVLTYRRKFIKEYDRSTMI